MEIGLNYPLKVAVTKLGQMRRHFLDVSTYSGLLCALMVPLVLPIESIAVEREAIKIADAGGTPDALSLYRISPTEGSGPFPAVLLFHGGSWRKGSPAQFFYYGSRMAKEGFVVYSAQYRLVGKETEAVEDCVGDAEAAFEWIFENAEEQNIDRENIFVGGGSAGGQLALYLFLSYTGEVSRFRGYIGYNPVVDVDTPRFSTLFRPYDGRYNPMELIKHHTPPILIFHGSEDSVVPMEQILEFKSKAQAFGTEVRVEVFDGATHSFFNYGKATEQDKRRLNVEAIKFLKSNVAREN